MPAASIDKYQILSDINPKSHIAEAYKTIRTNIQFSSVDNEIKVILIASSLPEEGKSTTSVNLAVTYAQESKKVLIIDADLRKPTLHRFFAKSNRTGLTNLLADQTSVHEAVMDTHIPNLFVLTSGAIPPNPAELLASKRMDHLLKELRSEFDVIIIDSPPTLAVTDSQILSSKCDGVVLVINHGKVKREAARKVVASLTHAKANLLGVVINNKELRKGESSYYYYYGSKE
jgi:capsular exopolysaccharide synthesis family protein